GVTASVGGLGFTGATWHALVNQGSLTLRHVAVTGNTIVVWSDSVTIYNEGTLVVQDSRITDNHLVTVHMPVTDGVTPRGGAIRNVHGTLTVANSTIANNTVPRGDASPPDGYGGGIYNDGGTVTITGSTLTGNSAPTGGGVYNGYGTVTITDSTISGNRSLQQ